MKVVAKPRGSGKTVEMIKRSAETGFPIVTCYETGYIEYTADKLGYKIPKPISYKVDVSLPKDIIVDNAELLLHRILGVNIDTCSVNIPFKVDHWVRGVIDKDFLEVMQNNRCDYEIKKYDWE